MANNQTTIRGTARNVQCRPVTEGYTQLSFFVQVVDDVGNVTDNICVELSGALKGNLAEGHQVEVTGVRGEDGILWADLIFNQTTNNEVRKYSKREWIKAWRGRFGKKTTN